MSNIGDNGLFHWPNTPSNIWVCNNELWFNQDDEEYVAYTDGSCDNLHKEHPGGAAYIIMKDGEIIISKKKGLLRTTNNRAEMLAIISAVASSPCGARLDIYTDSKYSMEVFSGFWHPKKNKDLFDLFMKHAKRLRLIVFHKVAGHSGNKYNEMVDEMAYSAYMEIIKKNNIPEGKYVKGGFK